MRIVRSLLLVAVVSGALLAAVWWVARPPSPQDFYDSSPSQLSSAPPGTLLKSEPFLTGIPSTARGWRILYTTTRSDGEPAAASGLVVVAQTPFAGPRPVVAWAHGTTGVVPGCAPTLSARPFANVPAVDEALREGWIIVATDYVGLGSGQRHAYLVGEPAARHVLDAVRAARALPAVQAGTSAVVWGHSQGGHAALWTGMRAATYAPDLRIVGVAALAPASDLTGLLPSAKGTMFGKIVSSYLIKAYAATYSDVRRADYIRSGTGWLVDDIAARCVGGWQTLVSAFQTALLPAGGIFDVDPTTGPLGARLEQNATRGPIDAPLLIAQGGDDDLVLPAIQERYVMSRCASGQALEFRTYRGLDHVSLVGPNSPLAQDLIAWSRDRFAGRQAANTCPR